MQHTNLTALLPEVVFHGRYRIIRCIAAGAMGAVYEAFDDRTNSPRALKVMHPNMLGDPDLRARFALEARVTGQLQSEHIVRVTDSGIDEGTGMPFLVMDLLQGEELGDQVKRRGALPWAEVTMLLYQVALALNKTHAAGIVHRDLKPENLFLSTRDDGTPCVKILDFGIAKVTSQVGQAGATRSMGTPLYMPPEQIVGKGVIGPSADIYALGHIAYTLLVGEPYWTEEAARSASLYTLVSVIAGGAIEPFRERALRRNGIALPASMDEWFRASTDASPERRFHSAMDAVLALAEALGVPPPGGAAAARERGSLAPELCGGTAAASPLPYALEQAGKGSVTSADPDARTELRLRVAAPAPVMKTEFVGSATARRPAERSHRRGVFSGIVIAMLALGLAGLVIQAVRARSTAITAKEALRSRSDVLSALLDVSAGAKERGAPNVLAPSLEPAVASAPSSLSASLPPRSAPSAAMVGPAAPAGARRGPPRPAVSKPKHHGID